MGAFNTLFGFGCFIVADQLFGQALKNNGYPIWGAIASLVFSHLVASLLAFFLYRKLVFKVTGKVIIDFVRFQTVYLLPFTINLVVLPFFVWLGMNAILSQGIILLVNAVLSYLGHKFFSFRRPKTN